MKKEAMVNEINVVEMKKELAEKLSAAGVPEDEARQVASKEIDSMGAVKTMTGQCPLGGTGAIACMFCQYGHMTDCHYPHTCEEASCSHYQEEMAGEIVKLDEEHAGLFDQGGVSDDTHQAPDISQDVHEMENM